MTSEKSIRSTYISVHLCFTNLEKNNTKREFPQSTCSYIFILILSLLVLVLWFVHVNRSSHKKRTKLNNKLLDIKSFRSFLVLSKNHSMIEQSYRTLEYRHYKLLFILYISLYTLQCSYILYTYIFPVSKNVIWVIVTFGVFLHFTIGFCNTLWWISFFNICCA